MQMWERIRNNMTKKEEEVEEVEVVVVLVRLKPWQDDKCI